MSVQVHATSRYVKVVFAGTDGWSVHARNPPPQNSQSGLEVSDDDVEEVKHVEDVVLG